MYERAYRHAVGLCCNCMDMRIDMRWAYATPKVGRFEGRGESVCPTRMLTATPLGHAVGDAEMYIGIDQEGTVPSSVTGRNYIGHNYIDHNYIGGDCTFIGDWLMKSSRFAVPVMSEMRCRPLRL